MCSYADEQGFVWFGTSNGLNRFDGSGFKVFNKIRPQSTNIEGFEINTIEKFDKEKFWIGTTKGLYLFDMATEVFTLIKTSNSNDSQIIKLFSDAKNNLWTITSHGISILKNNELVKVSKVYPELKIAENEITYTSATYYDSLQNGVWISTVNQLYFLQSSGQLLYKNNNPKKLEIFNSGMVYSIATIDKNTVWFSSQKHPLAKYSMSQKSILEHTIGPTKIHYNLYLDFKNRLWISNYSNKIYVQDSANNLVILPDASPETYKVCNEIFSSISTDKQNNLWITGPNGISKLLAESYLQYIYTLPANNFDKRNVSYMINIIADAGNGKTWFGKDDGLYLFDNKKNSTTYFQISKTSLQANRIFDMKLINNQWWCGTGNGLKILNTDTGLFNEFKYNGNVKLPSKISCIWIQQDKTGMIWLSYWSDAVYKYNPITQIVEKVEQIRSTEPTNPALTNSLNFFENFDKKIWFTNSYKGVKIFDINTGKYSTPPQINHQNIFKITKDKNHNIWLATEKNGILKANSKGEIMDSIQVNNGLTPNEIYDINFDKNGKLWAVSNEGVEYINTDTKAVSKLNLDMGGPMHEAKGAMNIFGNKLYLSVANKIAEINTDMVDKPNQLIPPIITEIKIFEKPIPFSASNPNLELKYDQNFFTIDFSSILHQEIAGLQYAYKLEGIDKDWVNINRKHSVNYTNVASGSYKFLVKCSDANGQWTEPTLLNINIKPPFYETWWFRLLAGLAMAYLGWYIYNILQKRKKVKAMEAALLQANEIKVLEISKMLAESQLMALRAQMNPLFVFSCLNSIQECIATQKYGEASQYLNKFSKLFRLVLSNSGKKMINILEEKEVLQLYLDLEQMRFEKSFNYSIKIDKNLDADEVMIPSMLIQPFVENALWHGLMHKNGDRNLQILFNKKTEEILECIIDDDGIGRRKSFQMKEQQSKSKHHESMGLSISKDRLEVLRKQGHHTSLQMTDKYDIDDKPMGTKIVIELAMDL